jgi:23S rRNA (guanosine2251-2'-O)-methyltransferase
MMKRNENTKGPGGKREAGKKPDYKPASKPAAGKKTGFKPASKPAAGEKPGGRPASGTTTRGKADYKATSKPAAGKKTGPKPASKPAAWKKTGPESKPWAGRTKTEPAPGAENLIIGRNPVIEALKNGREIDKLLILKDAEGSIRKLVGMAKDRNLYCQFVEKAALDRVAGGKVHQGVVAFVSGYGYCEPEDILERARQKGEPPFVIILDGIEDPHNLGAIVRTADGAGAHGIIIPKRRAAGLTDVAAKASAGAVEYVPVARVSNIAQTIDKLKETGVWIAACDTDGTEYDHADLKEGLALVIGAEGDGVSRLVKEKCDFSLSIPMSGKIASLNASNAAAVLMYEVKRQRKG